MGRSVALALVSSIVLSTCAGTGAAPSPSASVVAAPTVAPSAAASSATAQIPEPTPVPVADPRASGATAVTLATRTQDGPAYIQSYLGVYALPDLPPGSAAPFEDTPLPSIGYVLLGTVRWTWEGGSRDLQAGEAAATPLFVFHQSNPGSTLSRWYTFVVYGGSRTAFGQLRRIVQGPQLPVPQPEGAYTFKLDRVTLEPGGRTAAVTHGGATALVVLDGDIEVRQPGVHDYLAADTGVTIKIGGPMQILNRGSSSARVLEFFYTPDSQPFETPLASPI
jgi:quercetin dioxygenase-like cupin family protein